MANAKKYGVKTVAFGTGGEATARLFAWSLTPDGTQVAAEFDDIRIIYDMVVSGRHWALNSIAAIAAVRAVGGNMHLAAAALARLAAPVGRGARRRVPVAGGTILLVDESYNASPAAVRVLADTLSQMHQSVGGASGRLIMVLGDMRELGQKAPELHADLADSLKAARIDLVFTAGPMMKHLHDALPAPMRGAHAADSAALVAMIQKELRAGDVVAVKGSHASRMDLVVEALNGPAGGRG
jgi:UDP-N-acetylmuramoyl-tripeptide--D-alanyl-D-alanine ligase